MEDKKSKNKAKKILNIVLDVFCALLFLLATYEVVLKFTHNSVYLFGVRSDVVLTDSMSYVSEDPKVQKFLEGHDDRLKRGDLVYSVKIKDDTELNIYDIVIFKNTDNGKETIHRIVDIMDGSLYQDGKDRYVIRADTANLTSTDGAYPRDQIIAKYKSHVKGFGKVINFFRSIYGIILLVGLIGISVAFQYIDDKYFDTEKVTINSDSKTEIPEKEAKEKDETKKTE